MSPSVSPRAARHAEARARTSAAEDIVRLRTDSGLSRAELARGSGVDESHLRRIELAAVAPSLETYARIATALGADLALRLYPNTGPAIRDRHQAQIVEAALATLHPRWHAYPEIAVRRPSRGWIDLGLHAPRDGTFVAVEIQSEIRRLEQLIRWSAEKAASLPSWEGWLHLGEAPQVSQLLIVRDTRATRTVAREFARTLRTAYPAHPNDALAALSGHPPWPGSAVLWAAGRGTDVDPHLIVARPW